MGPINITPPQSTSVAQALTHAYQLRNLGLDAQIKQTEIQQKRQDLADDQTWRQAMQDNGNNAEAALGAVAGKMHPKNYFTMQAQVARMHQEKLTGAKSQQEIDAANNDYFGNLALGVSQNPDKAGALNSALDTIVQTDPSHAGWANQAKQHLAQNPNDLDNFLNTAISMSPTAQKNQREIRASADTHSAALDTARERDDQHETSLAEINGKRADSIRKQVESKQFVDQGMTDEQKSRLDLEDQRLKEQQRRDDNARQHWESTLSLMGAKFDAQQSRLDAGKPQTENSKATDRRTNLRTLNGYQEKEIEYNAQRVALGPAIANGNVYVDQKGKAVPMDVASKGDAATADTLRAEMKSRFDGITDQLEQTIRGKNSLLSQLGTPPTVSTEQAIAALRGQKKPQAPPAQGSTPAAAPAPNPQAHWSADGKSLMLPPDSQAKQPKRLTDPAMAQQYLQKAGGDKDKARKLAAADGWSF